MANHDLQYLTKLLLQLVLSKEKTYFLLRKKTLRTIAVLVG